MLRTLVQPWFISNEVSGWEEKGDQIKISILLSNMQTSTNRWKFTANRYSNNYDISFFQSLKKHLPQVPSPKLNEASSSNNYIYQTKRGPDVIKIICLSVLFVLTIKEISYFSDLYLIMVSSGELDISSVE